MYQHPYNEMILLYEGDGLHDQGTDFGYRT